MYLGETVKDSVAKMLTNRNVSIIKRFKQMQKEGNRIRAIIPFLADEFCVSESLINAVLYNRNYPHVEEAWEIVNNEIS